jgi:hypothetical protein
LIHSQESIPIRRYYHVPDQEVGIVDRLLDARCIGVMTLQIDFGDD